MFGVDVNDDGMTETSSLLDTSAGGSLSTRQVDVRSVSEIRAAVDACVDAHGGIDIVGNIAGVAKQHHLRDVTEAEWDLMNEINLKGPFFIAQATLPHLVERHGALINIASNAGLTDSEGNIKNFSKALKADSTSSVLGAIMGNSPVTSYVESAAGVAAGGRTGLTACAIGGLFLLAIFFAPLAMMIPSFAVAGALVYVALLMASAIQRLSWDNPVVLIPALMIMIMIPLTFSIADGIGIGFISYVALSLCTPNQPRVSAGALVIAGLFIIKFGLI